MIIYIGALVAGSELVQLAVFSGTRKVRYITTNSAGAYNVIDEALDGNLPVHLAAIRMVLAAVPPGMSVAPVHAGLDSFWADFDKVKDAYILEAHDWDGVSRDLYNGEPV